jgi:hypothetical protein
LARSIGLLAAPFVRDDGSMKRQGTGRVLTFAVTGALLGGVGIGGCGKHRGPYVNTRPEQPEPSVNPGPTDVQPEPEPEPEPDHVNEGPVDEPEPPHTNVTKQPEPEPKPNVNPGPA